MADIDEDLAEALQTAHSLEATASERWHKQEHAWKDGPVHYRGLKKYWHCQHRKAYRRQHNLRSWMMGLGLEVDTELGDTSYSGDVKVALTTTCDLYDELSDAYRAIHAAAKAAGDTETREEFHGVLKQIKCLYHKGEQLQQLLDDIKLPLFLQLAAKRIPK